MDPISYFQAIVLGALQGIAEPFPISSLGHGVIAPQLFGWDIHQNDSFFLSFLVATHCATAIVLFFIFLDDWKRILGRLRALAAGAADRRRGQRRAARLGDHRRHDPRRHPRLGAGAQAARPLRLAGVGGDLPDDQRHPAADLRATAAPAAAPRRLARRRRRPHLPHELQAGVRDRHRAGGGLGAGDLALRNHDGRRPAHRPLQRRRRPLLPSCWRRRSSAPPGC